MMAFIALLVVALVVASALADRGGVQRVVLTGTVGEHIAGEWISVANQTTDPKGVHIALRKTTAFEGDPALIKPGMRVTVWYRSVGERWPLADRVRAVREAATN
jgi:hypothetical protein